MLSPAIARRIHYRTERNCLRFTRVPFDHHVVEQHYHEMQDCEFTIERGKLWMLQTRTGKRTERPRSGYNEMVYEKLIDRQTALQRVRRTSSINSYSPRLILKPTAPFWRPDCRRVPAPRRARLCLALTKPKNWPVKERRSCWCGKRPAPMIFTVWSRLRPSLRRAAA